MKTELEIRQRMKILKHIYDQSTRDETNARVQAGFLTLQWVVEEETP